MARDSVGINNEVLTVNKTQLTDITLRNYPTEDRGIILSYSTGFLDANGDFVQVKAHSLHIEPAAFAEFATQETSGQGFYAALKDWCYQQIADAALPQTP